ncbi:MAG: DUF4160 domain-containing protein [Acidobacteriaceae bacterium]|nr:DUF4160 domain-containing protein [Acidobacteriaceae bacterium]
MLRFSGYRIVIYPNDHRPAHVHVLGSDKEAVFHLHCPGGPATVRENFGFARHELSGIQRELSAHCEFLCEEWRKIHGQP